MLYTPKGCVNLKIMGGAIHRDVAVLTHLTNTTQQNFGGLDVFMLIGLWPSKSCQRYARLENPWRPNLTTWFDCFLEGHLILGIDCSFCLSSRLNLCDVDLNLTNTLRLTWYQDWPSHRLKQSCPAEPTLDQQNHRQPADIGEWE